MFSLISSMNECRFLQKYFYFVVLITLKTLTKLKLIIICLLAWIILSLCVASLHMNEVDGTVMSNAR